jgi:hypothetical protein
VIYCGLIKAFDLDEVSPDGDLSDGHQNGH